MRVVICIYRYSRSILEVDNMQRVCAYDYSVAGSESLRYPFRKVNLYLYEQLRAWIFLLFCVQYLPNKSNVF